MQQTLKKYQQYLGYGSVLGDQVAVGQIEAGGHNQIDVGHYPAYKRRAWRGGPSTHYGCVLFFFYIYVAHSSDLLNTIASNSNTARAEEDERHGSSISIRNEPRISNFDGPGDK
jgi:hypothetical protein